MTAPTTPGGEGLSYQRPGGLFEPVDGHQVVASHEDGHERGVGREEEGGRDADDERGHCQHPESGRVEDGGGGGRRRGGEVDSEDADDDGLLGDAVRKYPGGQGSCEQADAAPRHDTRQGGRRGAQVEGLHG